MGNSTERTIPTSGHKHVKHNPTGPHTDSPLGKGIPLSTIVEIYALLVGAIIFGIGYCAGHLHTRARMRAAVVRGDFNVALDRVEVWCRYLAAELKDADARQDRRNDFMLKRAVGLMDTVQIPTLRAAAGRTTRRRSACPRRRAVLAATPRPEPTRGIRFSRRRAPQSSRLCLMIPMGTTNLTEPAHFCPGRGVAPIQCLPIPS